MALFSYKAYDQSGGKIEGQIEAETQQSAIETLKQQDLLVSQLKPLNETSQLFSFANNKVTSKDLEFLTSELSLLLESGVRIDRGIDIIRRTKAKPVLANLLQKISQDLKQGNSLSDALRKHPDTFEPLYCNLVELGEASGNLDEVFVNLANDLKFKNELKSKVKSAMAYPLVILAVCILSIFFIFNFIVPRLSDMFDNRAELPWYTDLMLATSDWMISYQWYLIIGLVLAVFALLRSGSNQSVLNWWHSVNLKLPVIKTAVLTLEQIRFNSALAMMIKAGVQIDRAIELAANTIGNLSLRREMNVARTKIKAGNALTPALQQTSLYPPFYVSLLEVGEESGNLERVFEEIASRTRQEFETWTQKMTTLIEPLMILFMGAIVGGVVVIMLMSMVSINELGI
jgi:type II secretory pathway component PulF